jgi:S1-C subfamily serine protease
MLALVQERLGVEVPSVSSQEAEQYELEPPQGVAIIRVDPNGALGKAGFEVQDILLAVDDQPIDSLTELVAGLKPHQRITVSALDHRSGATGDVAVVAR